MAAEPAAANDVGDPSAGSNPDPMAHLAPPLRSRAGTRRVSRVSQRGVRRLTAVVLVLVGLAGGYLWLRDSSVVAVRRVFITGISSSQEARVREALRSAALDMTTLHVRADHLRAAVAPYASVADLRADAEFPDRLSIEVVERRPAALLLVGGERVPVSAGGLLLRGVSPGAGIPALHLSRMPAGPRLEDHRARAAVSVLAAAPAELRGRIEQADWGDRGLQLELRDGPTLVFGSQARMRAKWIAAARVLADSSAAGATYIDARLPEWTAAGGVGPVENESPEVPAPNDTVAPSQTPSPTPPANPQP